MNIVHQLLSGGDQDFEDIYAEIPWIEIRTDPGMPTQNLLDRLNKMSMSRPRAFKTHSAPPVLPYVPANGHTDVKYIVVFRNPEEALVSFKPFLEKHTDEWYELWEVPKWSPPGPAFDTFYREVIDFMGMHVALFDFLRCWWPLRHQKNVLFLHFSDMKKDHEGSIRRISNFLGTYHTIPEWNRITEHASFPWMKLNSIKFDAVTATDVPLLQPGTMVRKGESGAALEDGMTRGISEHLYTVGQRICIDNLALRWFYEGGPLPT